TGARRAAVCSGPADGRGPPSRRAAPGGDGAVTGTGDAGGDSGGPLARSEGGLADTVETVLDKGVVIDVQAQVSTLGIQLLEINARVVVASIETYLRFAEAVDRLDIVPEGQQGLTGLVEGVTGTLGDTVAGIGETASGVAGSVAGVGGPARELREAVVDTVDREPTGPQPRRRRGKEPR
ncbi:MAG TPA: gas vesicle protein GvpJ, partial [Micromonospora sp.]